MLSKEEKVKKMNHLIEELDFYTEEYNNPNKTSGITDGEWDNMYFELQDLENSFGFALPNSPTQCIKYDVVNELTKVKHNHPMLSLAKTKSIDELKTFAKKGEVIAMLKLDGLSCSLLYQNGYLVRAETRGDGEQGEDITHNILGVKGVPRRINYYKELVVDGEILCTDLDFEPFAEEYKNSRNFASGSIRLLDSNECKKRNLTFVAWDSITEIENNLYDKLSTLECMGFIAVPYTHVEDKDLEISQLETWAFDNNYPTDGLVFKYNDNKVYEEQGRTSHHANGGLGFKFTEEEAETTLLDIEFTMGRSGALTPVAILEPVELDGSTISRASLHNISRMEEDLGGINYKNATVSICKKNEIIPQVVGILKTDDLEKIEPPKVCPICGGDTYIKQENESKVLMCGNPQCNGKLVNKIKHYCDMKKGVAIKGLSEATIEKLIDWGWIDNILDLYYLDNFRNQWIQQPGFGVTSVEKVLTAIEESKTVKLENFICALGIPLIGLTNSKEIVKHINTLEELIDLCDNNFNFEAWDTFGKEKSEALRKYDFSLAKEINRLLIFDNLNQEINAILEGKVFCVTGTTSIYKNRSELSAAITGSGGKVTGSVSKNTDYLINNDKESTSAKNKKAIELGVPIISEADFQSLFDF